MMVLLVTAMAVSLVEIVALEEVLGTVDSEAQEAGVAVTLIMKMMDFDVDEVLEVTIAGLETPEEAVMIGLLVEEGLAAHLHLGVETGII